MHAPMRLLGLIALVAAGTAAAEGGKLFKWTDAQGHVHYGDQPPANAERIRPSGASNSAPVVERPKSESAECAAQTKQVESYRAASRITETNSLGDTAEYDDKQREKLIARTERARREACGEALPKQAAEGSREK